MATFHRIENLRLRVDDDGSAHIEIVVPTDGDVDVVATWEVDYLPDDVQRRLRTTLAAPGLSVASDAPGEARKAAGRPPAT